MWEVCGGKSDPLSTFLIPPVITGARHSLFTFGGFSKEKTFQDTLYQYDTVNSEWHQIRVKSELRPKARIGGAMAYNDRKRSIHIFGGNSQEGFLNDYQIFSQKTKTWTILDCKGEIPSPRVGASLFVSKDTKFALIFGGVLENGQISQEVFQLNLQTNEWKELVISQESGFQQPCGRINAPLVETHEGQILLLGGWNQSHEFCDSIFRLNFQELSWDIVGVDQLKISMEHLIGFSGDSQKHFNLLKDLEKDSHRNSLQLFHLGSPASGFFGIFSKREKQHTKSFLNNYSSHEWIFSNLLPKEDETKLSPKPSKQEKPDDHPDQSGKSPVSRKSKKKEPSTNPNSTPKKDRSKKVPRVQSHSSSQHKKKDLLEKPENLVASVSSPGTIVQRSVLEGKSENPIGNDSEEDPNDLLSESQLKSLEASSREVNLTLDHELQQTLEPIIERYADRLLRMKKTFSDLKQVLVDDSHYFLSCLNQEIPELLSKTHPQLHAPHPDAMKHFARSRLLAIATEYFSLAEDILDHVRGEYVSEQIKSILEQNAVLCLPPIKFRMELTNDPSTNCSLLRDLLQATLKVNSVEIDKARPELADALSEKRQEIIAKLAPLEHDSQLIQQAISHWDSEGVPQNSNSGLISSDSFITLCSQSIPRDKFSESPVNARKLLSECSLSDLLSRLEEFQSWQGKFSWELQSFDEDLHPQLESLQSRVYKLRKSAQDLSSYLFAEDPSKALSFPKTTMLIRLFSKEQAQNFYDFQKVEIQNLKQALVNSTDDHRAKNLQSMKTEQKFLKTLLRHWQDKRKLCRRNCVWSLTFQPRLLAPNSMSKLERELLLHKLAEIHISIFEKEQEFQQEILNSSRQLSDLLKLGISLDVWSSEDCQQSSNRLSSFIEQPEQLDPNSIRGFHESKRFLRMQEKFLHLEKQIQNLSPAPGDLNSHKEFLIPPLEIRWSKLEKASVDLHLSLANDEIASLKQFLSQSVESKPSRKQRAKKHAKELAEKRSEASLKLSRLEEFSNVCLELRADWEKRSKIAQKFKLASFITLEHSATLHSLPKEESRLFKKLHKKRVQDYEKQLEILQAKQVPFRHEMNEIIQRNLSGFRSSEKSLKRLEKELFGDQEPLILSRIKSLLADREVCCYLRLETLQKIIVCAENISWLGELWKFLLETLFEFLHSEELNSEKMILLKSLGFDQYTRGKQIALSVLEKFPDQRAIFEESIQALESEIQAHLRSDCKPIGLSDSNKSKSRVDSKTNLSESEKRGLLMLTRGLENLPLTGTSKASTTTTTGGYQLALPDRVILLDFLRSIKSNQECNARLTVLNDAESIPFGISQSAIDFARAFSFKSRHLDSLAPLTEKLDHAWKTVQTQGSIPVTEQVSLKDLGILRTMERWGKDLEWVYRLVCVPESGGSGTELISQHPMYSCLVSSVAAHQKLKALYESIQQHINSDQTYQSGDILLAVWNRKVKTMQGNRPPRAFSFLMSFSKYEHTAKIYRNVDEKLGAVGEPRLSHMYREYHDSELALEDIATADVFRLNVSSLVVDKEARDLLQQKFDTNWDKILQTRFCSLESNLHSAKQQLLGGITNPLSRVMNIGTAAVLPWTRKRKTKMDFEKIRSTLYSNDDRNKSLQMTCSEFAAKSTIASLLELNQQLCKEFDKDEKTFQFISLPFPAKEKFKTMQPDRLRQLIAEKNALIEVSLPPMIGAMIKL